MTIVQEDQRAQIIVCLGDVEEFRYGIEGEAREDIAFAFPRFDADRHGTRATAKVVLRAGARPEHDVETFSQQRIIDDFLKAYAKWMGW